MGFHKNLLGDDLHGIRPKTYDGNPVGALTPEYEGEVIVNTDTNVFYRANGLTNADWEIVGGAGDISELSELSDVVVSGRADGETLIWNESEGYYEHGPGGITDLSNLEDVVVSGRADNDILSWNQTSGNYEHVSDIRKFEELEDVTISGRVDKSLIVWNESNQEYEHQTELQAPVGYSVYVDGGHGSDTTGDGTIFKPYKTIKNAINSISDNDFDTRYQVLIEPGIYIEDNPITLKNYVTLVGHSNVVSRVEAQNTGQALFDLPPSAIQTELTDLTFYNAAAIIDINNASQISFNRCIVWDCGDGYLINATAQTSVTILDGRIFADEQTLSRYVYCTAGRVTIRSTTFETGVDVTTVIETEGSDAFVVINGLSCISSNVTNGVYAKDNSKVLFDGLLLEDMTNALRADTGAFIIGYSFDIKAGTWDVLQESNGQLQLTAGQVTNSRKLSLEDPEMLRAQLAYQETGGEISTMVTRSFSVGLPEKGRKSSFGEGDSSVRGMLCYTYNGSTFTNVTTEAESPTNSSFTFPTTVNSGFYISWNLQEVNTSDYKQFLGFKINFASPMVLGTGDYVLERWNGSSWEEISFMVTDDEEPYLPRDANLQNLAGKHNIRFNCLTPKAWEKNDPISSGINRYWVRFRITSAIDFAPEIEEVILHANRSVFNRDGWLEYFGKARPLGVLPWFLGLVEGAASSPTNSDVYLSDNIAVGMQENNFDTGDSTIGFLTLLPFDLDTSCPIRLRLNWFGDDATAGDVVWNVYVAYSTNGDTVYTSSVYSPDTAPNEIVVQKIESVGAGEGDTGQGQQRTTVIEVPVNGLVSRRANDVGDILWISIQREGTNVADTYPGDAILFGISPVYTRWCEGAHEESSLLS